MIKSSIPTISAAEFATALALRPNLVAWFLGAGASAASGIPTGYAMIRDFKAQVFCRANNLSKREIDTGGQVWIDRIDEFFRKTSILPPEGDPTEYAAAFEAVYPQPRHRRQYIDDAIAKGTPCFGHRVLGSLLAARKVDCVFTTNFDPLVEEAARSANSLLPATEQARPTNAAIDSVERAIRCLNESDWPLVAKLHGDYQSISIKNTGSELEQQDEQMRHVAGNAPEVSSTGDYYQGKKSIPKPLQLIRHAGSGSLELIAHEALALTKMDWNNDALYDPVPVSIRYSQRLARTIANVPDLPGSVYPYRLFM